VNRNLINGQVSLAILFAFAADANADTIVSATGTFSALPGAFAPPTPFLHNTLAISTPTPNTFWNNFSYDSGSLAAGMNIGYLLTDSGGLAAMPPVLGADSVSQDLTAPNGGDPTAFNFIRSAASYNISMLFADSSLDTGNAAQGTTFGYYSGSTFTPLWAVNKTNTPGAGQSFDPTGFGDSYGFYATVCYAVGSCETYTTGNGNWGNNSGGAGWNHFALFRLASGNYAIGFEDANGLWGEGLGDYNDVVIELSTVSTPEPGTVWFVVVGIVGLLSIRRRSAAWGS
jgi:hypothetical protein